uniref:NADH-ubiquinone oxidoreductase chain 1 n=1 Tax=Neofoleyellides sp. XM-2022 TaxID=3014012 RepID=A0A9E9FWB1_9BILA|nr:NADH dehydrogenase subunit 1 [Neofoleyellides sp. XM-2022]
MLFYLGLLVMIVFILQGVAFLTLMERHLLGGSQCRIGPNKVGFNGVLQALFDGFKLIKKEQLLPFYSSVVSFLMVPLLGFIIMVFFWFMLPYFIGVFSFDNSFLFLLCLMGLSVFPVMLSGVYSVGVYSYLGGLRAASQSYSYEISFSFYLLIFMVFNKGLFLFFNFGFIFFLFFFCFFVMVLMDVHRAPFDFSECESELVSGFNVEYSSIGFVSLFLSEYGNILFFGSLSSLLFFDMSLFFLYFFLFLVIFCRSSYPRMRFDNLMSFCWLYLLPVGVYFLGFYFLIFVF